MPTLQLGCAGAALITFDNCTLSDNLYIAPRFYRRKFDTALAPRGKQEGYDNTTTGREATVQGFNKHRFDQLHHKTSKQPQERR